MYTLCQHCGQKSKELFTARDLNQNLSDEEFIYYRCNNCDLIFLDPIPKNLLDYYDQAYPAYQHTGNINEKTNSYDFDKITVIKKYAQGNKLLEIGPGNGAFAYLAKQEGFIVDAIEMDPACCKFLEEEVKVRYVVNTSDIAQALDQTHDTYDVIVMWHVLEHLKNPLDVIHTLPKTLSRNGIIVIAAPNPKAFQFKLFKQYWKHVDAPRHVAFVPLNSVIKKMTELGMSTLLATTNDKVSSEFNSFGWWLHSLRNFRTGIHNNYLSKILRIQRVVWLCYTLLVKRVEQIDGCGNAYLAIFKNDGTTI